MSSNETRPTLAASVEVTPKQIEKDPSVLDLIPPATRTYLVDIGAMSAASWGQVAQTLVRKGLEPVPHIAARRLESREALEERLSAMVNEAGVRDVLLIAGGPGEANGPFGSSMDVLETGLLDGYGIRRIAVAGHPEGSPDISDAAIGEALAWKAAFAERTNADMRITTQFGFDAEAALAWARGLQAGGITLPIHLGVAGPASIKSLLKYSAMCGVRASTAFAFKRGSQIASLLTSYSPEPYVQPIEAHVAADDSALIQQIHVFPFGGLAETQRWLVGRGSWSGDERLGANRIIESANGPSGNGSSEPGTSPAASRSRGGAA